MQTTRHIEQRARPRRSAPRRPASTRARPPHRDADALRRRSLGNRALESAPEAGAGPRPRLRVRSFAVNTPEAAPERPAPIGRRRTIDKGLVPNTEMQDQFASVSSFATETNGIGIVVDIELGESSAEYPDGMRWTQTIDTNVPLGGTTSPYVDPRPNDDTKPFYWTDAEVAARPTQFEDHPSRPAPSSGTTTWRALLSLNGVNGTTVTRFDSVAYGFDIDSGGTVSPAAPTSPVGDLITTHQNTLSSEFSGWTFN